MIIKTYAYPRAALIGNPSDGYYGKTMAFTFSNFQADITLYPSEELEILPSRRDRTRFAGPEELIAEIGAFGYYGGIRIIKAALKRFFDYCRENGCGQDKSGSEKSGQDKDGGQARSGGQKNSRPGRNTRGNFTIRYHTSIPPHLGLAGSSAIITACMRALMVYFSVDIPPEHLANLVLSVERDELGIGAGLQDRVVQAYQSLVYMDFDREHMEAKGYGKYEVLRGFRLPPLYIAYRNDLAEGSEVTHNNLRYRWEQGDPEVHAAMEEWGRLTQQFRRAVETGDFGTATRCINRNFDLRKQICAVSRANEKMVMLARSAGASAKFTGSGGAIIGAYEDEAMFERLKSVLAAENINVIKPEVCNG
jgi:glucuronokinase